MSKLQTGYEGESSPFDGSELVIYTADAEHAEFEPCTEWGKELGIISYSLWARFEEEETELPIYSAAEQGVWLSLSSQQFHPDPAEPVSDAFVEAVVNMVDEDVGEGWGDPTEEAYNGMRDVEKLLWQSVQIGFLKMESPEAAAVIDWCNKRSSNASYNEPTEGNDG